MSIFWIKLLILIRVTILKVGKVRKNQKWRISNNIRNTNRQETFHEKKDGVRFLAIRHVVA
jgi:hypothetical protein